jgi:hypothetical protein
MGPELHSVEYKLLPAIGAFEAKPMVLSPAIGGLTTPH